jgi:hypothetical protein
MTSYPNRLLIVCIISVLFISAIFFVLYTQPHMETSLISQTRAEQIALETSATEHFPDPEIFHIGLVGDSWNIEIRSGSYEDTALLITILATTGKVTSVTKQSKA